MRWWVSWWSGNYADEGCTKPPFKFWDSGHRDRLTHDGPPRDDMSLCAVIDTEATGSAGEFMVWHLVRDHFPDAEQRFCEPRADDWMPPADRFPAAREAKG